MQNTNIESFMDMVQKRNPHEPEFHQAVHEVVSEVLPFIEENQKYKAAKVLERMIEPERTVSFRVPWIDDKGEVQIQKGYRVQFNSAIGPYKGGLRFHPSVNLSILKFLGFEQIFKNALTTLPLGGGKGGSDFDPKGKSDAEVMRFTQSFMTELYRHIGADIDIPAGDIGVGAREIGYLFGQYKRIAGEYSGVLTGKGFGWGGSLMRPEATGFGAVYFAEAMLERIGEGIKGKRVLLSGAGNVAQGIAEKTIQLGAKLLTVSDSDGFVFDPDGMDMEKLSYLKELKNEKHGRIKEYADRFNLAYTPSSKPWGVTGDIAFPAATQNEINESDANTMVSNGIRCVVEGANMPSTPEAVSLFHAKSVLFAPGKASNAGGVAVSGLEMTQNSIRMNWTADEVDAKLKEIMRNIHTSAVKFGASGDSVNYVRGANIAGFVRVADAMLAQGVV